MRQKFTDTEHRRNSNIIIRPGGPNVRLLIILHNLRVGMTNAWQCPEIFLYITQHPFLLRNVCVLEGCVCVCVKRRLSD